MLNGTTLLTTMMLVIALLATLCSNDWDRACISTRELPDFTHCEPTISDCKGPSFLNSVFVCRLDVVLYMLCASECRIVSVIATGWRVDSAEWTEYCNIVTGPVRRAGASCSHLLHRNFIIGISETIAGVGRSFSASAVSGRLFMNGVAYCAAYANSFIICRRRRRSLDGVDSAFILDRSGHLES